MPLTAAEALDDLRQYVESRGFIITNTLSEVFAWIERFSESVGNDPYPHFFLLGLLRNSREFRDLVAYLGGDPDAGAEFVEGDIEQMVEEAYGDNALYSETEYRTEERPAIIDYTIDAAHTDGRTDLRVRDLVLALVRYQVHLDKTESDAGQWIDHTMRTPFLTLAHIAGEFDKSLDVKLVELRKAVRGEPATRLPKHVVDAIRKLLDEHPDMRRNGFVIMPFGAEYDDVHQAIAETLASFDLRALRADDTAFDPDLLANIEAYMRGCSFGIVVHGQINANVAYEAGYMRALGKPVCVLKERSSPALPTDSVGQLYLEYDSSDARASVRAALRQWLISQRIVDQED
jgi:hypothetical protein